MSEETFFLLLKGLGGFAFGAVLGSFITMLSYRVPRGLSIIAPRSFCPACKRQLRNRDLVPLFSYLFSRGRCGQCAAPVPPRYFFIEIISAVFIGTIVLFSGFSLLALLLASLFIALFSALLMALKI